MIPRAVFNKLVEVETQTGRYRTRICHDVLCDWHKASELPPA